MTAAPKNDLVAIKTQEVKVPGMRQPTFLPDKKRFDPEFKNTLNESFVAGK